MKAAEPAALKELAAAFDVLTRFHDVTGKQRAASPASLVAVLRELGAELDTADVDAAGASDALRAREASRWRRVVEPVIVAWAGRPGALRLRVPSRASDRVADVEVTSEDGTWSVGVTVRLDAAATVGGALADGETFVEKTIEAAGQLAEPWPIGYHRLTVRLSGTETTATVLSAPAACAPYPGRAWGAFLPAYAVRRDGDRGVGDLGGLRELLGWIERSGGGVFATLPLFAAFNGPAGPFEASPYSPVSTLFWNELYADIEAAPEFALSREARDVAGSDGFRAQAEELRAAELIDYRAAMTLARRVLEPMARAASADPNRRAWLERAAAARPELDAYARFRAMVERTGASWRTWPAVQRDGTLDDADIEPEAALYHRYVQALLDDQLAAIPRDPAAGRGLLLDIPVGVHPDGFDVWRDREAFALGASTGAPPDSLFSGGQDWGTPPPHREHARRSGYLSLRERLRRTMQHAAVVRIDHVMGLHRLYWVPHGMPATEGVYVRYPADELYAVLAIESGATGAAVVGEDLGTVPSEVRATMGERGVLRTYVLQLELWPGKDPPLPEPPARSLAALNTHDLPTFAAYVEGLDVGDRLRLGLIDRDRAAEVAAHRARLLRELEASLRGHGLLSPGSGSEATPALLRASLAFLAESDANIALINLEDLTGERLPQNRPGTGQEEPNWRRRTSVTIDALMASPYIADVLADIDARRRARVPSPTGSPR